MYIAAGIEAEIKDQALQVVKNDEKKDACHQCSTLLKSLFGSTMYTIHRHVRLVVSNWLDVHELEYYTNHLHDNDHHFNQWLFISWNYVCETVHVAFIFRYVINGNVFILKSMRKFQKLACYELDVLFRLFQEHLRYSLNVNLISNEIISWFESLYQFLIYMESWYYEHNELFSKSIVEMWRLYMERHL